MPAEMQGAHGASTSHRLSLLLHEALIILDEMADYPELGARLQEVIDALEEQSLTTSVIHVIPSSSHS